MSSPPSSSRDERSGSSSKDVALKQLRKVYGDASFCKAKPRKASAPDIKIYQANNASTDEVVELCRTISTKGKKHQNETSSILFGELQNIYYKISSKVASLLNKARKNRLVYFDGETLYEGQDDQANVTLLRNFKDIEDYYNATGELLYNDHNNAIIIKDEKGITIFLKINFSEEQDVVFDTCEFISSPQICQVQKNEIKSEDSVTELEQIPEPHGTKRKMFSPPPSTHIRLSGGTKPKKESRVYLDFCTEQLVTTRIDQ